MAKQVLIVFLVFLTLSIGCFGQSKSEQIKQLQKIASENEQRAKKAEELAERSNQVAQAAMKEAERQRYLSLAMSLSLKSLEIEDKSLSALLALQAYNFNSRYQGYPFDNNIYNGLLAALRNFGHASKNLNAHTQPVHALTVKPEISTVISLGNDGRVMRWTKQNGEWEGKESTPPREGFDVYATDLNPEGRLWVIGGKKQSKGEVGVYDLAYASKKIQGFSSEITKTKFTPEARSFYALCNGGKSIFLSDFKLAIEVISTTEKIVLMDLNRDGSKLAGVSAEGNLYVWDIKKEYAGTVYKIAGESQITSMAFTSTGRDIAIGNEKGEIRLLAAETGVIRKTLLGHSAAAELIVFSSSGRMMMVLDKSNSIRIWNLTDMNKWPLFIKEDAAIRSVAFSPDENEILCAPKEKDFSIHAWSLNMDAMARELCKFLTRNMSAEEWEQYVAPDVDYQATCTFK